MKDKKELTNEFKEVLLSVNRIEALRVMKEVYENSDNCLASAADIIRIVLEDIGVGWEEGEISLSQVYMSGILCEECVNSILSEETAVDKSPLNIGIGVLLDHHGLGKKIISSIIRLNGYDVIDFGDGLSVKDIVSKAIENELDVLLISTLMLPSALKVKEVVKKIHEEGKTIKVLAGGAPFRLDKNLWIEVGLDTDVRNNADIIRVIEEVAGV